MARYIVIDTDSPLEGPDIVAVRRVLTRFYGYDADEAETIVERLIAQVAEGEADGVDAELARIADDSTGGDS